MGKANSIELRVAAEIVRKELMERGEWYDALVTSIVGYMVEYYDGVADPDDLGDLASGLANRLVGIEEN